MNQWWIGTLSPYQNTSIWWTGALLMLSGWTLMHWGGTDWYRIGSMAAALGQTFVTHGAP